MGNGITVLYSMYLVVVILACIFAVSLGRMKILEKAGRKRWKAFVPFLGTYELYAISWTTSAFWAKILALGTFVIGLRIGGSVYYVASAAGGINMAISILDAFYLARSFGNSVLGSLVTVLLYPLGCFYLGWGDLRYCGRIGGKVHE